MRRLGHRGVEAAIMQRFLERHRERIVGTLSGFDRVLFRGTLRLIAYLEGFDRFLPVASACFCPSIFSIGSLD